MNRPKQKGTATTAACNTKPTSAPHDHHTPTPPGPARSDPYKPKECPICGQTFQPASGQSKYCSLGCRNAARRAAYVPKARRTLRPLADRLWSRVDIGTPNDCWEWQGYRNGSKRGYGQIGLGRKADGLVETHRAAWLVTRGHIPPGLVVRHRCDNPPCCNPLHLMLGTQAQNVQDAIDRGRIARGFALPHCRLSMAQVMAIRDEYVRDAYPVSGVLAGGRMRSNARELAVAYGVTESYVLQVASGKYRGDL